MDKVGAMYFTVTVFSTVGFGDITAKTDLARTLVTVQMLVNLAARLTKTARETLSVPHVGMPA
jgi:hypothetical protein